MTLTFPRAEVLPYAENPESLFAAIADLGWPVWLDSGRPWDQRGRYDIMAAGPVETLVCEPRHEAFGNSAMLAELRPWLEDSRHAEGLPDLPFHGGAIGLIGYEFGARLLPKLTPRSARMFPDLVFGLFDWAVVVDHLTRSAWLVSEGRASGTRRIWPDLLGRLGKPNPLAEPESVTRSGESSVSLDDAAYRQAFAQLQRYIHEGDCYQANLARRFSAPTDSSGWDLHRHLRRLSPAPYGAFWDLPFGAVSSVSPELFMSLRGRRVETRPIKGTRPRGTDAVSDVRLRHELLSNAKERAENLMIVDLLRNDLGKVCRLGSIEVPSLFEIQSFAGVHHLVSRVRGELREGLDALDLLAASFPGGSITGAPKLRAMQIIRELEPVARELYCGAIGWLGYGGDACFNIAIRTALARNGQVYYWSGGGIVADSQVEAELEETLVKARGFLKLLNFA